MQIKEPFNFDQMTVSHVLLKSQILTNLLLLFPLRSAIVMVSLQIFSLTPATEKRRN